MGLALYFSVGFLLIAIGLFILVSRQKRRSGLPQGKVIYSDTSTWSKVDKPLFDPFLGLSGKPDYLVKQGDRVIPVEVKSGFAPQVPYDSHIYQLAAYCLLVEHEFGLRPEQGVIHYRDRTFAVDFTPVLETSIREAIREIQGLTRHSRVDRSHENPARCKGCGYRSICDQALRI